MWIRKTKEEYKNDRFKKFKEKFTFSIVVWPFAIVFFILMRKLGFRGRSPHQYEESWNQIIDGLYKDLLFLLISIIFTTLVLYISDWLVVCDKCGKEKDSFFTNTCSCGGKFISEKKYKWID